MGTRQFASEAEIWCHCPGDTTSAMCAIMLHSYIVFPASSRGGLRTNDIFSLSGGVYRRAISLTADLHFTPTAAATSSLLSEGILQSKIVETGNTVVDAIQLAMPIVQDPEKVVTLPKDLACLF